MEIYIESTCDCDRFRYDVNNNNINNMSNATGLYCYKFEVGLGDISI